MGEAYLDWQKKSGGIKLNDVIEEYRYVAAGKQIKAGDLVNYINGIAGNVDYGESVDTQLGTATNSGRTISAVRLDDYRIFIAHSSGSNENLHAMVITIEGKNIVKGTDIVLSSASNTGSVISTCLLPNGNVFIVHSYGSDYYLYGIVCKIDGTTITKGTDKKIVDATYTGQTISACTLLNGNVFIAYSTSSSNRYLHGIVCTISDTSIGTGSATNLSGNVSKTGIKISTCLLPNGNVFITHSSSTDYYLYGMVVTIDGTTITKGSDTALQVGATKTAWQMANILLPNGKVLLLHSYDTGYRLYGMIVTINGTTITAGTDTELLSSGSPAGTISACMLSNEKIFVAHSQGSNALYGITLTIKDTIIQKGANTLLIEGSYVGSIISSLGMPNDTIFIAHSYDSSYRLYAQIWGIDETNNIPTNNIVTTQYEQQVTPAIEPPFNAVALSSGVGGTDTEHNEQVKIARVANILRLLPVGTLVKDVNSTFLGEPVIWKIADKNHEGYPDGSVTLITERSIAIRPFDAKEPNNNDSYRKTDGNNRYSVSNIRQWLNSDAEAGQWYSAQHSADQEPSSDYVHSNAYSDKVGFINGFSQQFKNALLETTLAVALNTVTDGGGSETVVDKIFLVSNTELGLANENSIIEGTLLPIFNDDASRIAFCTTEAIEDSNYSSKPADENTAQAWWLRTPLSSNSRSVRLVTSSGTLGNSVAYYGHYGVRPLCNIPSSTIVSDKPDADGCYTLFAGGEA